MTRKVVQNTRPNFSHLRGGAGHETRHVIIKEGDPLDIPTNISLLKYTLLEAENVQLVQYNLACYVTSVQ